MFSCNRIIGKSFCFKQFGFMLIVLTTSLGVNAAEPITIGVYDNAVRILFFKDKNGWISGTRLEQLSREGPEDKNKHLSGLLYKYVKPKNTWYMSFGGKSKGQLQSEGKKLEEGGTIEMYTQKVSGKVKPPKIPLYGKNIGIRADAIKQHPVILNNKPYYTDHEQWKRHNPKSFGTKSHFAKFIMHMREGSRHPLTGNDALFYKRVKDKHSVKCGEKPMTLKNTDLAVKKAYRNKQGKMLVLIGIRDHKKIEGCVTAPGEEEFWGSQWYLVEGKKIRHIGNQMTLVDAGDYDKDGKSEVIFNFDHGDDSGYVLYYNNFKNFVTFGISTQQ